MTPGVGDGRMSDWTKVLLMNVVLATMVVALVFHAPWVSVALGSATAGLTLWVGQRLGRLLRSH
jgi:hypothetical protein